MAGVTTLRVTVEAVLQGGKRKTLRVMEISEDGPDVAADRGYRVIALGESVTSKRSCTMRGPRAKVPWGPWRIVARAIAALKLDLEGP